MSFVSDVAHACAEGYYAAPLVPVMRADALRQWGSARSRFKRTVGACGANSVEIVFDSCLIPRMHGFELVCFRCGIPAVVVSFLLIDCLVD